MKSLEPISEAEVVAAWLRGEIKTDRFQADITTILEREGISRELVTKPDTGDHSQDRLRQAVLKAYRGYGTPDSNLLAGFPVGEVLWERVLLDAREVLSVLYIDWDYWLELSGGTRRPIDAARRIREGHVVYGVPNDGFLEAAEHVRSGHRLPPMIVVSAGQDARMVVVEGHSRLTGYALAADALPDNTEVILGTAEAIEGWWAY